MSALGNAVGFRDFAALIDELDLAAQTGLQRRAVESGQRATRVKIGGQEQTVPVFASDQQLDKAVDTLSPGAMLVAPDGALYQVAPDGKLIKRN